MILGPLTLDPVTLAVLTQPDTTILIEPGLIGRVDRFGNLILERSGGDTMA